MPDEIGSGSNKARTSSNQKSNGSLDGRSVEKVSVGSKSSIPSPSGHSIESVIVHSSNKVIMPNWVMALIDRIQKEVQGMDEVSAVQHASTLVCELAVESERSGMSPVQLQSICERMARRALSINQGELQHNEVDSTTLVAKKNTILSWFVWLMAIIIQVVIVIKYPWYVLMYAAMMLSGFLYASFCRASKTSSPIPAFVMNEQFTHAEMVLYIKTATFSTSSLMWTDIKESFWFLMSLICKKVPYNMPSIKRLSDGKGKVIVKLRVNAPTLKVIVDSCKNINLCQ